MNEIKKRETSTIFECDGRSFTINAYDPMAGNYIAYQIMSFVMPMGIGQAVNSSIGSEKLPETISSLPKMSKKDFIDLQVDILSTVEENMPTGHKAPVVRENGTYGVQDVSMGLLLKLIIQSITFNFKDFFVASQSIGDLLK